MNAIEKRQKQKEFLKKYYFDYDPKRHDAFVIRYQKEQQADAEYRYRVDRGLDAEV